MNKYLYQYALDVGIKIDSFGVPVVDKHEMLELFARKILLDLQSNLPPEMQEEVALHCKKYLK